MPNEHHDTERRLADLLASAADAARQHAEACRRDSRGQDDTERAWLIGSATMAENLANRLDDYARSHGANPRPTAPPTPEVQRLDFSKPPPGYAVGVGIWGAVFMVAVDREEQSPRTGASEDEALAAAWAHHKARHDPPGMDVFTDDGDGSCWHYSIVGECALNDHPHGSREGARAAAWAWYEDALEVASKVDALLECPNCDNREPSVEHFEDGTCSQPWCTECDSEMGGLGDPWPECLAWTSEQRAEVRRWLVDSTAEMPEALCG